MGNTNNVEDDNDVNSIMDGIAEDKELYDDLFNLVMCEYSAGDGTETLRLIL